MNGHRVRAREALQEALPADDAGRVTVEHTLSKHPKGPESRPIIPQYEISENHRINPRGVKRKMSTYPLRPRKRHPTQRIVPLIRIRGSYMNSIGDS